MDRLNTVYDKDSIKKKYSISTKYVISMFARMQYHKDYRTFLNTASRIIKDGYDVTFLCVGGGALLNKNMAIVTPSERKSIIFTGQVKNVDELMSVSDVSVLCTNANAHQEGISNSILESMAFGVPVIATTGGGTNEIVIDGYNGYLISPKDEDALYKKILDFLNNEHLRVEISNNAKKHIIDNFTLEKSTKQYIELYKSVLNIV
jgi:glycosyltransferase involved in cell wall biosynthesis